MVWSNDPDGLIGGNDIRPDGVYPGSDGGYAQQSRLLALRLILVVSRAT